MYRMKIKKRSPKAMTMIEIVISLALMVALFSVIVPQFRSIQLGWDLRAANAETIQNGRVFVDYLTRNLATAVRITSVSEASATNGYIEFEDAAQNTYRCDIAANNYIEFGPEGDLSDLAGPVSILRFTCYALDDLDNPVADVIADVDTIRFVKIDATFTSTGGKDKTFTTSAYLHTNYQDGQNLRISKKTPFEFDTVSGQAPALCQIDNEHYLCAYGGPGANGWAVVLTVDTTNWTITKGAPFEFDSSKGLEPALVALDDTHYLCAYSGYGDDGWAVVLTVNTGNWTISKETPFEFNTAYGATPALVEIDHVDSTYLCAYQGEENNGWATVLTVDTGTWTITQQTPFEFDNDYGSNPALAKIDDMYYLCTYTGKWDVGWAIVLEVSPGLIISEEAMFEYDTLKGTTSALLAIDTDQYLCAYQGSGDDGWSVALSVNPSSHVISKETSFEFNVTTGKSPALCKINGDVVPDADNFSYYLCVYDDVTSKGWAEVLIVNNTNWSINKDADPYEYDSGKGQYPALEEIDGTHFLCAYQGGGDDGWATILSIDTNIEP